MTKFDFSRFNFFGNNSSNASQKRADKQRRGRQCRIEELEGREMLSVTPWALTNDFDLYDSPVVEVAFTPQTEQNQLTPLTAEPEITGKIVVGGTWVENVTCNARDYAIVTGYKLQGTTTDGTAYSFVTWELQNGVMRLVDIAFNQRNGSQTSTESQPTRDMSYYLGAAGKFDLTNATALRRVYAYENDGLKEVDLSGCTNLLHFSFRGDWELHTIKANGCTSLLRAECGDARTTTIGNRTNYTPVKHIYLNDCISLTRDFTGNFNDFGLETLQIKNCASLYNLNANNNNLTSLDLTGCKSLRSVSVRNNANLAQLTLDEALKNTMEDIRIDGTKIMELDVEGYKRLNTLWGFNLQEGAKIYIYGTASRHGNGHDDLTNPSKFGDNDTNRADTLSHVVKLPKEAGYDYNQDEYATLETLGLLNHAKWEIVGDTKELRVVELLFWAAPRPDAGFPTEINLTGFTSLRQIWCDGSGITKMNLTGCSSLDTLVAWNNPMTELNLTGCTSLEILRVYNCQLTAIDLTACKETLRDLRVSGNTGLTLIDVANFTKLQQLEAHNTGTAEIRIYGCTSFWDFINFNADAKGRLVTIPPTATKHAGDAAFLAARPNFEDPAKPEFEAWWGEVDGEWRIIGLRANPAESDRIDGVLNLSGLTELQAVTIINNRGAENPAGSGIYDGPGITGLNVTGLTKLQYLRAYNNRIATLDLSTNTSLKVVDVGGNGLTSLDISAATGLERLLCANNNLRELILDAKDTLRELHIQGRRNSPLLNLSGYTALEVIRAENSNIMWIDVSGCTKLTGVYAQFNGAVQNADGNLVHVAGQGLAYLNVAGCTSLRTLDLNGAALSKIDISDSPYMVELWIENCQLNLREIHVDEKLPGDMRISQNQMVDDNVPIVFRKTDTYNDNDLQKVKDQGLEAYATWRKIDGEYRLTAITAGAKGLKGALDFSGCDALVTLDVRDNGGITSLNLSGCVALGTVRAQNNSLTALDVTGFTRLTRLEINGNQIEEIEGLASCKASMNYLWAYNNSIKTLDLTGFSELVTLNCGENGLETLILEGCKKLDIVYANFNNLTELDLSDCTVLREINVNNNKLLFSKITQVTSRPAGWPADSALVNIFNAVASPQSRAEIQKNVPATGGVDLSALHVTGNDYKWYKADGTDITSSATNASQVFTFTGLTDGDIIYCVITNPTVSGSTAANAMAVPTSYVVVGTAESAYDADDVAVLERNGMDPYASYVTWTFDTGKMRLTGLNLPTGAKNFLTDRTLDLTGCKSLTTLQMSGGEVYTLILKNCTALVTLDVSSKGLRSIDVTGCAALTTLNVSGNALTFDTLPPATGTSYASGYIFAPQNKVQVPEADTVSIEEEFTIDLSAHKATAHAWYLNGTKINPSATTYTAEGGVFTFYPGFLKVGDVLYCDMTSTAFTGMTLQTVDIVVKEASTPVTPPPDPDPDPDLTLDKPVITAVGSGVTSVEVTITDGEGKQYEIQYGVEAKGKVKTWMTAVVNGESLVSCPSTGKITVDSLSAGITYQFRVRQVAVSENDGKGVYSYSEWSAVATGKTTGTGTATLTDKADSAVAKAVKTANKVAAKANKTDKVTDSVTIIWGQMGTLTTYILTYTIPSGIKGVPGIVVQDIVDISGTAEGGSGKVKLNGVEVEDDVIKVVEGSAIAYKISNLAAGATYKVSIVGQNSDTGATSKKAITVSQKTEKLNNGKAPKSLAAAKTDIKINGLKLKWAAPSPAPSGAVGYIVQVWAPKTKTEAPKLVQEVRVSGTEATIIGLPLAGGTKYIFAVKAVDTAGAALTAFAAKAIATAKFAAPSVKSANATAGEDGAPNTAIVEFKKDYALPGGSPLTEITDIALYTDKKCLNKATYTEVTIGEFTAKEIKISFVGSPVPAAKTTLYAKLIADGLESAVITLKWK